MRNAIAAATAVAVTLSATTAQAFCGFYVSGSNKKMFNDATNVVLMRSGTRTVLAMQNDYRGPLEDFAMVVPVPVVLKQTDVRVVPKEVFDRLDSLSSPRLVEYWEQDPCPAPVVAYDTLADEPSMERQRRPMPAPTVATDTAARGYAKSEDRDDDRPAVPPVLASFSAHPPSITAGVATNITWTYSYANQPYPEPKCTIDNGVGSVISGRPKNLSLEKTTNFKLTCANRAGKSSKEFQISVIKIEAEFDVAEYKIVILSATEAAGLEQWLKLKGYKIPDGAEPLLRPYVESGSKFFVAKVDPSKVKMVDGRVALSPLRFHYDSEEFSLPIRLGMANSSGKQDLIINIVSPDKRYEVANYKNVFIPTNFDVKPSVKTRFAEFYAALFDKTIEKHPGAVVTEYAWTARPTPQQVWGTMNGIKCDPCPDVIPEDRDMMMLGADVIPGPIQQGGYVLTRLHARYGKNDMKDDLRFREAKPIAGGREQWSRQGLEYGANPSTENFFQARYAIRYWWTGPIRCKNPRRGVWGGPPHGGNNQVIAAQKTAFAPRGKLQLASVIKRDLWEIGYKKAPLPKIKAAPIKSNKTMWLGGGALLGLLLFGAAFTASRRRSQNPRS